MTNTLKFVIKITLLFLCVTLLVLLYKKYTDEAAARQRSTLALNSISGKLVYALSPEPERLTDIFEYDLSTGVESKLFDEKNLIKFSPSISPDGRFIAFSAAPIDFTSKLLFPHTEHLQIYIYDREDKSVEKISTSTTTFRNKMAKWSPDGRYILYHGYKASAWEANLSVREPNNWLIYLYDTKTKETREMSEGIENLWAPSGTDFFYLKNDGIHVRNIFSDQDIFLIEVADSAGNNPNVKASGGMTLGVSSDGSKLAWASPKTKEVVLYDISYTPKLSVKLKHRLKTGDAEVYHAVFSPDNKFIAVQESEFPIDRLRVKGAPGNELSLPELNLTKPRITIYELENFRAKKIRDLVGYDFFGTSLSQWVSK